MNTQDEASLQNLSDKLDILISVVLSNKDALTLEEAAAYTKLTRSYLYKLTYTQQIPHYKPRGKMLYFDRAELNAWLKQGRVSTIGEIDRKAANRVAGVAQ